MRVVCPFVNVHPLTQHSVNEHAPDAEWVFVGRTTGTYWKLLCDLWDAGTSFLLIEQDTQIHSEVIGSLATCPRPWCLFPYPGPKPPIGWSQTQKASHDRLLYQSLGCTRFGDRLLKNHPRFMADLAVQHWQYLDTEISPGLIRLGYRPHVHAPAVLQHHVWDGQCACGTEHEAYPIDGQGRYRGNPVRRQC